LHADKPANSPHCSKQVVMPRLTFSSILLPRQIAEFEKKLTALDSSLLLILHSEIAMGNKIQDVIADGASLEVILEKPFTQIHSVPEVSMITSDTPHDYCTTYLTSRSNQRLSAPLAPINLV
jgi:hypothetical protein